MRFQPSTAFIGVSWLAAGVGIVGYCVGLWNADMLLNEKGYYLTVLLYGLFSAISVQKSVRDRLENIPVTDLYYGISWLSAILSILLLVVGRALASSLRRRSRTPPIFLRRSSLRNKETGHAAVCGGPSPLKECSESSQRLGLWHESKG